MARAALADVPETPDVIIDAYSFVARLALGQDAGRIARAYDVPTDAIIAQMDTVAPLLAQLEEAVRQRFLAEGDAEVTALAKAKAPEAFRNLMDLADHCADPKTKRAANKDVIELAGVVPAKRIEITTNGIIDQMNAAELAEFAAGKWPERFKDQMKRIQVRQQLLTGAIDVTPGAPVEVDETA